MPMAKKELSGNISTQFYWQSILPQLIELLDWYKMKIKENRKEKMEKNNEIIRKNVWVLFLSSKLSFIPKKVLKMLDFWNKLIIS